MQQIAMLTDYSVMQRSRSLLNMLDMSELISQLIQHSHQQGGGLHDTDAVSQFRIVLMALLLAAMHEV